MSVLSTVQSKPCGGRAMFNFLFKSKAVKAEDDAVKKLREDMAKRRAELDARVSEALQNLKYEADPHD